MKLITTRVRFAVLAMLLLAFTTFAVTPHLFAATTPSQATSTLVQGTTSTGGVFSGILKLTSFSTNNNQLVANGILNGTITNADGTLTQVVNQAVSNLPVSSVNASCPILNLILGPLDLNLLGLTIHLNQVVLNITAVPGAGNLLGNLLCAVANLLNGGIPTGGVSGLLTTLSGLLTQIVNLLNGV